MKEMKVTVIAVLLSSASVFRVNRGDIVYAMSDQDSVTAGAMGVPRRHHRGFDGIRNVHGPAGREGVTAREKIG